MYDIASRLAGFLACQTGLEESRVDTVRFGLEVLIGEIIKWSILLSMAALLGVLPGVLFAMVSTAVFRMVSGGAHCEDYWRCLALGLLIFLGGGKLGVYAAPYISQELLVKAMVAGFLVMATPVLVWAPGEVPNRKINERERGLFKKLSFICLASWTVVTVFLIVPHSSSTAVAGFLAMLVQVISITPLGYCMINVFDMVLSRILGERRCTHA